MTRRRSTDTWTEARLEELRRYWNVDKLSAKQIAETKFGGEFTRNAILGAILRRPGFEKRGSPLRPKGSRKASPAPATKVARSVASQAQVLTNAAKRAASPGAVAGGQAVSLKARGTLGGIRSGQAAAERRLEQAAPISRPRASLRLAEPKQTEPIVDDGRRNVALPDLAAHGCKWATTPHSAPSAAHRFCNAPRLPERPYCAEHCEKARDGSRVSTAQSLEHLAGVDQAGKAA